MEWIIEKSIVCPITKTGFAVGLAASNFRLIIWYEVDYFLKVGSCITHQKKNMLINGQEECITMLHTFPYTNIAWNLLNDRISCPGNENEYVRDCINRRDCAFELCPYGCRA